MDIDKIVVQKIKMAPHGICGENENTKKIW